MEIKNADKEYLLGTLIDIEIDNLMDCKNAIDLEMVQQLIEDMQAAPEVVVIGSRASTVLVSYTTYISTRSASGHRVLMRPTRKRWTTSSTSTVQLWLSLSGFPDILSPQS